MTLKDIGTYKNRLVLAILKSNDICELMLGKGYNTETVDEDLIYKYVFPYLYVQETQTETKSYICMEVDVPRTSNFSYKDMKIIVWCYSHKDTMKYSKKGYLGTKTDILSDMVDRLLNSSRNYGIGRLKLESATYFMPSSKFYGRQLIYSCSEFNIDEKL